MAFNEITEDGITTCSSEECGAKIDTNSDDYQSTEFGQGGTYCSSCVESDTSYLSRIWRFAPDKIEDVHFGDLVAFSSDGGEAPEWFTNFLPEGWKTRNYVRTDGWRGHFETAKEFVGIKFLGTGWSTGYTDIATSYKQDFNNWVDELCNQKISPPVEIFALFEPTSNVFSTGVDVFVKEADFEVAEKWALEWFGDDGINQSLR